MPSYPSVCRRGALGNPGLLKKGKHLFLFPSLFLSKKDKIDTYPISLLQRNICLVKFVLKMWANISAKKLL